MKLIKAPTPGRVLKTLAGNIVFDEKCEAIVSDEIAASLPPSIYTVVADVSDHAPMVETEMSELASPEATPSTDASEQVGEDGHLVTVPSDPAKTVVRRGRGRPRKIR